MISGRRLLSTEILRKAFNNFLSDMLEAGRYYKGKAYMVWKCANPITLKATPRNGHLRPRLFLVENRLVPLQAKQSKNASEDSI